MIIFFLTIPKKYKKIIFNFDKVIFMILDFNNLSNHQKLQIDEISPKIENDYNILIENILKTNKNNNDIFFSNII